MWLRGDDEMISDWGEAEWVGDKCRSMDRQPEGSRCWHVVARCTRQEMLYCMEYSRVELWGMAHSLHAACCSRKEYLFLPNWAVVRRRGTKVCWEMVSILEGENQCGAKPLGRRMTEYMHATHETLGNDRLHGDATQKQAKRTRNAKMKRKI